MKIWLILVLFLACMFLDGIIFPGLFGFRESFLTIIFIVIMVLYNKAEFQSLIIGLVFFGLTEFYWGLKSGTLILPLLISAGAFLLLNSFFNFRSRVLMIISGLIVFVLFWISSVLVTKIL